MPENSTELIQFIIGSVLLNLVTIVGAILTWIRTSKMMGKDLKEADLNLKSKELTIAEQYDMLATRASERTAKIQERLSSIENKIDEQEQTIKKQATVIEEQSNRLDLQDIKIKEQEDEISKLKCELDNSKKYNSALIEQMRQKGIIPKDIEELVDIQDCSEIKAKAKKMSKKISPDKKETGKEIHVEAETS